MMVHIYEVSQPTKSTGPIHLTQVVGSDANTLPPFSSCTRRDHSSPFFPARVIDINLLFDNGKLRQPWNTTTFRQ